ncbi:little elongation complex subunit 1 isoform X2 [Hemicordylus capensis]|uniref:little elongation complex subunit 1 isoform X2 n=1 Tax=Hemicordylus capensis TaxID=884348 RepID=UPI0023049412|nr:little elongation complex subunit 1 isoform X2 [Hemicordylus capensis]
MCSRLKNLFKGRVRSAASPEKIKLLLEELWICIDSSTGRNQINKNDYLLVDYHGHSRAHEKAKTMLNHKKCKKPQERPSHSSPEACTTQMSVTSLQIKLDSNSDRYDGVVENSATEMTEACNNTLCKDKSSAVIKTDLTESGMDLFYKEQEELGENLQDILKWVRPLPPLLSPIQFSPTATPDVLFEDLTDSSDEEMDQHAEMLESFLGKSCRDEPMNETLNKNHSAELESKCNSSSVKSTIGDPQISCQIFSKLKKKEAALHSDHLTATSRYVDERDEAKHLEKNSELMETDTEIAAHTIENFDEKTVDMTKTKDKTLMPDLVSNNFLQRQEKTVELMHVHEVVTNCFEHALEESCDLMKEELTGVPTSPTDDQPQTPKIGLQQQTQELTLAAENMPAASEKLKEGSNVVIGIVVVEDGSRDIQTKSNIATARTPSEEHTEQEITDEPNTATEELCTGRSGVPKSIEDEINFSNCESFSDTEHPSEQVQQEDAGVKLTQAIQKDVPASYASIKSLHVKENHCNEETCNKENKQKVNGENELMNIGASNSSIAVVADGCKNSSSCTGEVIQTGSECSTAMSIENEDGSLLMAVNEAFVRKDKPIAEETKSVNMNKECLQTELLIDQKDSVKSQVEPDCESDPTFLSQAAIIKDSVLLSEEPVKTNHMVFEWEAVTESASELGQVEDADAKSEQESKIHHISNSFHSTAMEDEYLMSKRVEEKDSELLNTTNIGTVQSVITEESEKAFAFVTEHERTVQSCLIPGSLQCGINDVLSQVTNLNGNSSDSRKCAVEDPEMNSECSVTNKVVSEQNTNEAPPLSVQDVLQAENVDPSPSTLTVGSKSSTEFTDVRASNLETSFEHFNKKCQDSDASHIQSPVPVCISPSSPIREDANHIDYHDSGEDLKGREAHASVSEGNRPKHLDCCSHCNNKNEVEVEQLTTSDPQRLAHVKDCCSVVISRTPTPETPSLKNSNTASFSVASRSVPVDEELLISPSEKLGSPLRSITVEHTLDEAAAKETDEILNNGIKTGEVDEFKTKTTLGLMDSSFSYTLEEVYPLRKVDCTKQHPRLPVFKEELSTVRNSHAVVPSSVTVSCGDVHKLSHVAEEASPKDKQATICDADSLTDETVARTSEHSYAAQWASSSENAPLKLAASVATEMTEERQAEQNVSSVASLMIEAFVSNKKSVSKSSASDLEASGDGIAPDAGHTGSSVETSEIHSASYQGKASAKQDRNFAASGWTSNKDQNNVISHHVDGDAHTSYNKKCYTKNAGRTPADKTNWNSLLSDSKGSGPEQQKLVPEKLKSFAAVASQSKNRAQQVFKPSDSLKLSVKVGVKGHGRLLQKIPSQKMKRKSQQTVLDETITPNADTSTPTKHFPKTLTQIRQEMGPPLPPLLLPLIATPPRTVCPISPIVSSSSQSCLPSSLDKLISPLRETPVPPLTSPLMATPKHKSPAAFTTPSPSETIGQRTLSSPLQFCATTPKHALPVPGRLPPSAVGSAAPPVPQENSVKTLDIMYPELSPLARTLSILKGNIQLSRSSLDGENIPRPACQISGFKAIASKNTAFVKTGTNFKTDPEQPFSNVSKSGKRTLGSVAVPRSAKVLRLDKVPKLDLYKEEVPAKVSDTDIGCPADETICLSNGNGTQSTSDGDTKLLLPAVEIDDPDSQAVTVALEKISRSCVDLFPIIRSHFLVDNTSKIPVMSDEEREVVFEFGVVKKYLAEPALQAILNKLKNQRTSLGHNRIQSFCRVYVGICRQLGDLEKARLFCYSVLKEDFPQSDKLTLFIGNAWSEIFTSESVINRAIQLVVRQRGRGEVLKYFKTYLSWEENTPVDIGTMVSSLLLAIRLCPQMEFHLSEQYGEDLKEGTWEYVFAIDLLCSHQKWHWTHENIISKELWPIMDKWIKNRTGNGNTSSPSDIIVATVLRLIGRLGQIGLRGGFFSAVENISSVVGAFLQYAKEKDVPWGVQLAAAYALCDLGPSNPSGILEAIHAWKAVTTNSLPPAVTSGIAEVRNLLKYTQRPA